MLMCGFQYRANVSERPFSHFVHRAPYYIRLTSPRLPPQAYITISESSPNSTHGIGSPRDSGRPLVPWLSPAPPASRHFPTEGLSHSVCSSRGAQLHLGDANLLTTYDLSHPISSHHAAWPFTSCTISLEMLLNIYEHFSLFAQLSSQSQADDSSQSWDEAFIFEWMNWLSWPPSNIRGGTRCWGSQPQGRCRYQERKKELNCQKLRTRGLC